MFRIVAHMDLIAAILRLSEAYCAAAGVAEATLSTKVLGAGGRLAQIRAGGSDVGVKRCHLAIEWFSANWPEGAAWPDAVERPAVDSATVKAEMPV